MAKQSEPQEQPYTVPERSRSQARRADQNAAECIAVQLDHRYPGLTGLPEGRFQATLQAMSDGVTISDMEGRAILINQAAAKILGYESPQDLLSNFKSDDWDLWDLDDHLLKVEDWPSRRVMRGISFGALEVRAHRRDTDKTYYFSFSGEPVRNQDGQQIMSALVTRDITERKRMEYELRESEEKYRILAEELQKANRRKDTFLSVLSHELRNPLAAMLMALSLLDRAQMGSEKGQRFLDIIHRQVGQLARLTDDLVDVSRLTQNKSFIERQCVDLKDLVTHTADDLQALYRSKGIILTVETPDVPLLIQGDPSRLSQVLSNLLHNAWKFTPTGGTVSVRLERDEGTKEAVVCVADTGVGIDDSLLPEIFEPFVQWDSPAEKGAGLGLGLFLVKGLVELHEGRVSATSAGVGQGAELTLRLPLHLRRRDVAPVVIDTATPAEHRILLIDDNSDLVETLSELLTLLGHEVYSAVDGSEGLALARQRPPTVLLCDIGLPGMSGLEVAAAFQDDERLRHVYCIAFTGYARPEDIQRAREAGFDLHLNKPVDIHQLRTILNQIEMPPDGR